MNSTKTKHKCSKCGSDNVDIVSGVTIGDPFKDRKTDFVILLCKGCMQSSALRIDHENGKETISVIENNKDTKGGQNEEKHVQQRKRTTK